MMTERARTRWREGEVPGHNSWHVVRRDIEAARRECGVGSLVEVGIVKKPSDSRVYAGRGERAATETCLVGKSSGGWD